MVLSTKDNGVRINKKEREKSGHQKARSIKVNIKKDSKKVGEYSKCLVEITMKVSLKIICWMGLESLDGKTGERTKEIGNKIRCMVMEFTNGKMEWFIQGSMLKM